LKYLAYILFILIGSYFTTLFSVAIIESFYDNFSRNVLNSNAMPVFLGWTLINSIACMIYFGIMRKND